jgi:sugar-specific transcriptional regulator TrmB
MRELHRLELEELGLSSSEAQVYLALLRTSGGLGASAVANATGIQRTAIYPVLDALLEKGMAERGAGYGGRFTAVPPRRALPSLIAREKEELANRQRLAGELADKLETVAEPFDPTAEVEVIQVLRDPRLIAERFERLELEAERQIEIFCKPPVIGRLDNPAQAKAMRRGVRIRSVYEQSALDDPALEPYLSKWVAAGEEARFYDGELPHKLAVFDRQSVLMPLVAPSGQGSTLLIRHPQLAMSLGMLFDSFWDRAKPFSAGPAKHTKKVAHLRQAASRKLQLRSGRQSTNSEPSVFRQKVHSRTQVKTSRATLEN